MNEIFLLSTTPCMADCIERFATSYDELQRIAVNYVCQKGACHENLEIVHAPCRKMITVIEDGMFETEFHIIELKKVEPSA